MLIALGVTGGIGAYKAVEVARGLQKRGHDVVAVMTHSAAQFVGPVTFEAITRRRVITDQFETGANADIEHIALASTIDLLLVAPATANIIGKFANGIADDFLSTLLHRYAGAGAHGAGDEHATCSSTRPCGRTSTRSRSAASGSSSPGEGYLACGWIGKGRLAEPDAIVAGGRRRAAARGSAARPARARHRRTDLRGFRSGALRRQPLERPHGVSRLRREATRRGAEVTLVSGPTVAGAAPVHELVRVRSASEMHGAVMARAGAMQSSIMAAAVADYSPAQRNDQKVPKSGEHDDPGAEQDAGHSRRFGLRGGWRRARRPLLVGFAAETENVVTKAIEKRDRKHADLIVANDVSRDGRRLRTSTPTR